MFSRRDRSKVKSCFDLNTVVTFFSWDTLGGPPPCDSDCKGYLGLYLCPLIFLLYGPPKTYPQFSSCAWPKATEGPRCSLEPGGSLFPQPAFLSLRTSTKNPYAPEPPPPPNQGSPDFWKLKSILCHKSRGGSLIKGSFSP